MHWWRKWQPTPVFLPGESQGRGAWWAAFSGVAQSRTRLKRLSSSSSSLSSGEGNGTPLQYSCLENPMDLGAWWAESMGSLKSQTRLNDFTLTFHFHALVKEMATHSSILAWRIPGMGSWWAAVYGVAQSQTWLQWLSTSSNSQGLTHYVLSEYLCDGISHMYSKSNPSSGMFSIY